jgi:hypothetical protein
LRKPAVDAQVAELTREDFRGTIHAERDTAGARGTQPADMKV